MGVLQGGILGTMTGRVGPVVGMEWKGKNTVRRHVIPANPNTSAQQSQRALFAAVVGFARLVLDSIIHKYWEAINPSVGGYAAFMSENLLAMTSPTTWNLAILSKGSLEGLGAVSAVYSGGNCTISWNATPTGNGLATDKVVALVFDTANNVVFLHDAAEVRDDGTAILAIGTGRTAANLKAYAFAYRTEGENLLISDSGFDQVS